MAFFRVGMRVKKVRGINDLGAIAIVVGMEKLQQGDISPNFGLIGVLSRGLSDLQVLSDRTWLNSMNELRPATSVALTYSDLWEPIIENPQPCESEFKQSLDRLLEKVGERV